MAEQNTNKTFNEFQNKNDVLDEILGNKETETQSQEKQENQISETEQKEVPLHEHPKFKEVLEKNRLLEQELQALKQMIQQNTFSPKQEEVPEWFKTTFGDDKNLWQNFKDYVDAIAQQRVQDYIKSIEMSEKEVENKLQELKAKGETFDDEELLEVMEKYKPSNEKGERDFEKGLEILKLIKKSQYNKEKEQEKQNAQTSNLTGEGATPKQSSTKPTLDEIRKRDWFSF